jgi:hypothetical protein
MSGTVDRAVDEGGVETAGGNGMGDVRRWYTSGREKHLKWGVGEEEEVTGRPAGQRSSSKAGMTRGGAWSGRSRSGRDDLKFETTITVGYRRPIFNVSLAAGFGPIFPNFGSTRSRVRDIGRGEEITIF